MATTNQLSYLQKVTRQKSASLELHHARSSRLALEMRQKSGPSIYLPCLLFFPYMKSWSKARCHILALSWHLYLQCVYVRHVYSCMIVSKAVGSKRAAQCRILAITNEQRVENKTYERKAEQRSDSHWLVEMCIVSSFSCQHFFKPPQRKEEEEGGML